MTLLLDNAVINMEAIVATYIEAGELKLDIDDASYSVINIPENALQQIAVAYAQGQKFIELSGALLKIEDTAT